MLTLQFGQCGNQLGNSLFGQIIKDINSTSPGTCFNDSYEYIEAVTAKWFEGTSPDDRRIARVILIDAEKKVVNKIIGKNDLGFCYRSRNLVTPLSSGSANNWAFGYTKTGPEFNNPVMDAVRREVERADRLDSFLCIMSCAGGTGSGLGSYITSSLREEFPLKNIIAVPVMPFPSGEVATQNYNCVLSLAKIVEDSDLVVVLENQMLQHEATKSRGKASFPGDLNDCAARKILSVFQPARNPTSGRANDVNYVIGRASPHPGYKLTSIESVLPSDNQSGNVASMPVRYPAHFKNLRKEISRGKSLSNVLITRGTPKPKGRDMFGAEEDPMLITELTDLGIYSKIKWLNSEERITQFHQKRNFLGQERFTSILSNNSRIAEPLEQMLETAWKTYTHGAFLHQYTQHGLEDDDFLRAFGKVENTVRTYKSLRAK